MSPGDDDHDLGIGPVERNSAAGGTAGVEGVEGGASVDEVVGVAPTDGAQAPTAALGVDRISADLAAGSLTPAEAKALLIDHAVAAQLPEGADPALVEAVRTEVAAALLDDPVLAALLDPHA